MSEIPGKYQPDSYKDVMQSAIHKTKLEAGSIRKRGIGGILTMVSSLEDVIEQGHLIGILADNLGIERTDIEHIDIEIIANAIQLGIERYKLGILDETLQAQSLPENVFQYVYRYFGKSGEGWRLGQQAALDNLRDILIKEHSSLEGTPFAEFIKTLDIDLENQQAPRLVVLHYPPLDSSQPIQKKSDVDTAYNDRTVVETIDKFIHIYSIVNQVYPGRFQKDNPHGHVLLNIIDPTYRYFTARNPIWLNAYEHMWSCIETPTAHQRDAQIRNAGDKI